MWSLKNAFISRKLRAVQVQVRKAPPCYHTFLLQVQAKLKRKKKENQRKVWTSSSTNISALVTPHVTYFWSNYLKISSGNKDAQQPRQYLKNLFFFQSIDYIFFCKVKQLTLTPDSHRCWAQWFITLPQECDLMRSRNPRGENEEGGWYLNLWP